MARTLIRLPQDARRGDVVEISCLIAHPMETGYRPDAEGRLLPRDILRRFTCHWGDELVFSAELHPAISANPYLAFTVVASETATLRLRWTGDNGFDQTETATLTVSA